MPSDQSTGRAAAGDVFTASRRVDAPRELVFRVWTEPEHLSRWWGPKGFEMLECLLDLRPGGEFLYGMRSPQGHTLWGKWVFREIDAPERLSFVASFSDEQGNVIRAPFSADWPLRVLSTVIFDEQEAGTLISLHGAPFEASEAERATFAAGRDSLTQGWAGTFGQLDEYLALVKEEVAR
jgi:uncharacterized protein YndB with AHSA1/START domain